jgi:hypothetical protein
MLKHLLLPAVLCQGAVVEPQEHQHLCGAGAAHQSPNIKGVRVKTKT